MWSSIFSIIIGSLIGSYVGYRYELYKESKIKFNHNRNAVLFSIASFGAALNELCCLREITAKRVPKVKEIKNSVENKKSLDELAFNEVIRFIGHPKINLIDRNEALSFLFLYDPQIHILFSKIGTYIEQINNTLYDLNSNIKAFLVEYKDETSGGVVFQCIMNDHLSLDDLINDAQFLINFSLKLLCRISKEKFYEETSDYFLPKSILIGPTSYSIRPLDGFEEKNFFKIFDSKNKNTNFFRKVFWP